MKKVLKIILMIFAMFALTSCGAKQFIFKQSVEEIESVEFKYYVHKNGNRLGLSGGSDRFI